MEGISEPASSLRAEVERLRTTIVELTQTQARIGRSEQWFRSVFEGSRDAIFLSNEQGYFVDVNNAAAELTGYTIAHLKTMHIADLHSPEDLHAFNKYFQTIMSGTPVNSQARILRADGTRIEAEFSNRRIEIDGQPLMHTVARDVTERIKTNRALRESEQRFRTLIENTPIGVYRTTPGGRIISANRALLDMLGYATFEELANRNLEEDGFHPEYPRAGFRDRLEKEGSIRGLESSWMRSDGTFVFIRENARAIRDADGNTIHFDGTVEDITAHRQNELALEVAITRREQLNRLHQSLLESDSPGSRYERITQGVVDIFGADFCRIWLEGPGDLCEKDCPHATETEPPHACRYPGKCLHLVSSSGRYSHTKTGMHSRIPIGCYLIGSIAADSNNGILIHDVQDDDRITDRHWAASLNLKTFAGYPIRLLPGRTTGVLALFSKYPLRPEEDAMLSSLAYTVAHLARVAEMEAARRQSENTLRTVFDTAVDCIFIKDANLRYTQVNSAVERLYGLKAADVVGRTDSQLFGQQAAHRSLEVDMQVLAGQVIHEEYTKHINDALRTFDSIKVPMRDSENQIIGLCGIARDISHRKSIEQDLIRLRDRLNDAQQIARIGSWEWLIPSNRMWWSDEVYRIFECDPTTFRPNRQANREFYHPDDMQRVENAIAHALQTATPFNIQFRIVTRSGTVKHVHTQGRVEPAINSSSSRLLGTLHDITERKRTDQVLHAFAEQRKELERIINNSPAIAFLWRAAERWPVEYVSDNIRQFGYNPKDFACERIRFADIVHPDDLERVGNEVNEHMHNGLNQFDQQYRVVTKSGETRWVDDRTWVRRNNLGRIMHFEGIILDVTQRINAELELQRYRNHLEELVTKRTQELELSQQQLARSERLVSLGTLAGGIAHEINNPVGGILLAAQYALSQEEVSELQADALRDIVRDAIRCRQIINNIRAFALSQTSDKLPHDLNAVARRVRELTAEYAAASACRVELELSSTICPVMINATGIEQVVVNLIRNAIEASAHNIHVRTEHTETNVVMTIADDGNGITPEQQKHLFDPFYTTRQSRGGTGLGLSIAHRIIHDHNATIEVIGEPNRGTTFSLSFPKPLDGGS